MGPDTEKDETPMISVDQKPAIGGVKENNYVAEEETKVEDKIDEVDNILKDSAEEVTAQPVTQTTNDREKEQ